LKGIFLIQCSEKNGALVFTVRVVPRASQSRVAGEHDGALRVRVAAPPVDGAANEELLRTLARALNVPVRDVEITSGHTSKLKQVRVANLTRERLAQIASGD
jgi:uncharacterized protein (TIGR00251 family)